MRTFLLNRLEDISGVSGTGIIAEGCVFSSGQTVIHWLTGSTGISIYPTLQIAIEIHGHNGSTIFQFQGIA